MGSFFCSWSGGKDSCLALYKAMEAKYIPKFLLTMCIENGDRSRSHGLSQNILLAQADALTIPLITINSSWEIYRDSFIQGIRNIKEKDATITYGVFGDIDIDAHGQWEKEVCAAEGLDAYLPLWKRDRKDILKEFLSLGFKAMIVAIDANKLEPYYLGRWLDESLINEFEQKNIDPCGENGEYHSVVFDGPIFRYPLDLNPGNVLLFSGYYFLDVFL